MKTCVDVPDLYYRWEAAWGGAMLLGTETIAVMLFNAGFDLEDLVVRIHGMDDAGRRQFALDRDVGKLPRGESATIEVASYELPSPANDLTVSVISGRFASAT